jgi:hypothetical protein
VVLENEKGYAEGIKTPDGRLDDKTMDIKGIESDGNYTVKNAFRKVNAQKAEIAVLYFHKAEMFSEQKVKDQWKLFKDRVKRTSIKEVLCVIGDRVVSIKI